MAPAGTCRDTGVRMGRVRVSKAEQIMENDAVLPQSSVPAERGGMVSYVRGEPLSNARSMPAADRERTGVFTSLVREDGDIAGLVAYSIYKQNKLDWLQAFEAAKGRVPDEGELSSYIIGESTPRRLATYRHLAEATLAGKGPDVDGATPARSPYLRDKTLAQGQTATPRLLVVYGVIAVLCLIGFWMAAHYTLSSH